MRAPSGAPKRPLTGGSGRPRRGAAPQAPPPTPPPPPPAAAAAAAAAARATDCAGAPRPPQEPPRREAYAFTRGSTWERTTPQCPGEAAPANHPLCRRRCRQTLCRRHRRRRAKSTAGGTGAWPKRRAATTTTTLRALPTSRLRPCYTPGGGPVRYTPMDGPGPMGRVPTEAATVLPRRRQGRRRRPRRRRIRRRRRCCIL